MNMNTLNQGLTADEPRRRKTGVAKIFNYNTEFTFERFFLDSFVLGKIICFFIIYLCVDL
jgi:hypothetical protein